MIVMLVNATLPSGEVCRHVSGELLDSTMTDQGRDRELAKFRRLQASAGTSICRQESRSSVEVRLQPECGWISLREVKTGSVAGSIGDASRLFCDDSCIELRETTALIAEIMKFLLPCV